MKFFVNASAADALPVSYARVSVPLARSEHFQLPDYTVAGPEGKFYPHQDEILAHWPDGSVRVFHSTVQCGRGQYDLNFTEDQKNPPAISPLVVEAIGETVNVRNGVLVANFGGTSLLQSISLNGVEYLNSQSLALTVEGLEGHTFSASQTTTVLETSGPLRAVIAQKGKFLAAAGTSFLDFKLRWEFLAGVEGFTLAFTFLNLEPGADFHPVESIGLDLKLVAPAQPKYSLCLTNHGIFGRPSVVESPNPLDIRVDDSQAPAYLHNHQDCGDQTVYPFYLLDGHNNVEDWGLVRDGDRLMAAVMEDFTLLRPKSMNLCSGGFQYGIWPREAGTLNLQQGRSRQVKIHVAFPPAEETVSRASVAAHLAQLQDVWRGQLPAENYAQTHFFDQSRVLRHDPASHPRFESWLDKMGTGLQSVARFFDLGDTPDSGYQRTYFSLGRQHRLRGEDGGGRWYSSSFQNPALALNNLNDFEPVWVNNEYDVIFALGTEYLRTADLTLFQKLRWFCRHTIEVDFLHFSDHRWLHRAQPAHSARHTTTGAYPSHFWTQGLTQYYFLTGDPDALEIINALADKTIENFDDPELGELNRGLNREAGWGVLSLVCAYEASGNNLYDQYARKLLDNMIREGLPADLPHFSFGHTSILIAARQYLQVHEAEPQATEDTAHIKQWFLAFVDLAIACSRKAPAAKAAKSAKSGSYDYDARNAARGALWSSSSRPGIFSPASLALDCLAYAYEMTGRQEYILHGLRSLEALLHSPSFESPSPEGKPFAMQYRTWINFLGACDELDLLKQWEYKF